MEPTPELAVQQETYPQRYNRELAKRGIAAVDPVMPQAGKLMRRFIIEKILLEEDQTIALNGNETRALFDVDLLEPLDVDQGEQKGPGWSIIGTLKSPGKQVKGRVVKWEVRLPDKKMRRPTGTTVTLEAPFLNKSSDMRNYDGWILKRETFLRTLPGKK